MLPTHFARTRGRKRLPLDPVEYSFQEMGCKLGVTIKHSFLVSYEKEDLSEEEATDATSSATAADAEADAQNSESGDEAQFPQGKAVL